MIIELEEPFKSKYRKGYLQKHPNGRQYVCLYNSQSDRTIISYARYILCVNAGYVIESDIEADHDNNDHTDDNPSNIKPLHYSDNIRKAHINKRGKIQSDIPQTCVICSKIFYNKVIKQTCCDFNCKSLLYRQNSIKNNIRPPTNPISDEKLQEINRLADLGKSRNAIANELGIDWSTVNKYLSKR